MSDDRDILRRLEAAIAERRAADPKSSYVASLEARHASLIRLVRGKPPAPQAFDKAATMDAILKKVGEEATEAVIASKSRKREDIVHEVADLWFHTLVLLGWHGIALADVLRELERREGRSGIEERNSRPQ